MCDVFLCLFTQLCLLCHFSTSVWRCHRCRDHHHRFPMTNYTYIWAAFAPLSQALFQQLFKNACWSDGRCELCQAASRTLFSSTLSLISSLHTPPCFSTYHNSFTLPGQVLPEVYKQQHTFWRTGSPSFRRIAGNCIT